MKEIIRLKTTAPAAPYLAVFVGLYILKNAWAAIVLYHAVLTAFLILGCRKDSFRDVFAGWNCAVAVISVVVCALVGPILFVLWQYIRLENIELGTTLQNFGLSGLSWYLFMIYFVTAQPLLEELYWRWFPECGHKYPSWPDFAFAGYHVFVLVLFIKWPWVAAGFAVLAVAGWAWRRMMQRFGGLAVPLLSHIAADVSIVAAAKILAM